MLELLHTLLDFHRDERGLTTVEYAVAGGLIVAALIAAFVLLGNNVGAEITRVAGQVGG
ncbi:Flp family type IVb pilin [Fontimonas sp. SYSU GA230001]|uniref:Flp family type IVb pilin n=1 Tax=Fontimonas sp. SYSU GA230001 TaxID=3142450 RepID=UPI0032B3AF4B